MAKIYGDARLDPASNKHYIWIWHEDGSEILKSEPIFETAMEAEKALIDCLRGLEVTT